MFWSFILILGPIIFITGATFCWSCGSLLTKKLVELHAPLNLLSYQLVASVAFLWLLVFLRRAATPIRSDLVKIGVLGLFEPGLAYICSTFGLKFTSVSVASLIFATEPAMVVVLAWGILKERPSAANLVTLLLSTLGVILATVTNGQNMTSFQNASLIALSTFFAALYVVLNQYITASGSPLARAAIQQSAALILIWCCSSLSEGSSESTHFSFSEILMFACSGVIQYAFAFWLYLLAVNRLPVTVAALFLTLIPVFTIMGGYLFLNERLSELQLIGASLVLFGLCLPSLNVQMFVKQLIGHLVGKRGDSNGP